MRIKKGGIDQPITLIQAIRVIHSQLLGWTLSSAQRLLDAVTTLTDPPTPFWKPVSYTATDPKGSEDNVKNNCGRFALHIAASKGNTEKVQRLVKGRAGVNTIDMCENLVLHSAIRP